MDTNFLTEWANRLYSYSTVAIDCSREASIAVYCFALQYQAPLMLYTKMASWYLAFAFWVVVWIPFGFLLTILTIASRDKKRYYNCAGWVLRQWVEKGGYISFRWCNDSKISWIRWPHFLWVPPENHACLIHYVPINEDRMIQRVLPSLYFDGYVRHGDDWESQSGS